MAKLAIKGHVTRGKEIIEILEMLGGKNRYHFKGDEDEWFVLNGNIQRTDRLFAEKGFTLEEFLEKYPYKVGDKVIAYYKGILALFTIQGMRWNPELNKVEYKICSSWLDVSLILPYKEETMEERKYKELRMPLDDYDKLAIEVTIDGDKITPPENYLIGKITKVDDGMFVEFVKKQPQYPKTYLECAKILGRFGTSAYIDGYKGRLLGKLQELIICRDAYWKIAGEQMGLGKPWEPDWTNPSERKYCITNTEGNIIEWMWYQKTTNKILAFPTAEMRDAFKENFDNDIEFCKEFL